ncbi:enoyl-CoA hydratase [Labrys monachus]|nr:enoyl-CoA hydratase [Labrys monachus]
MAEGVARSDPGAETSERPVLVDSADGITRLTLNRPAQFNALSEEMLAALKTALDDIAADGAVRCVVLAGAGKAFCAGHDLRQMMAHDGKAYFKALFEQCSTVMQAIRALPVPVIAQVQGVATAAGCQLVAACDLAVAASSARLAVSGINLGLFCSTPAVALSRNVAPKAAFDMLFTGRFITAARALELGLVNAVAEDDGLEAAVRDYTSAIAAKSAAAVRLGKQMFYAQRAMPLDEAYRFAGEVMADNMMLADAQEGIGAFLNKGRPAKP